MSSSLKIKAAIDSALRETLEEASKKECKRLAKICERELTQEYQRVIDTFYGEYTPVSYKRHSPGGYYSTSIPYYANPGGTVFYGGVRISPDGMPDHQDPNSEVLSSFLSGFHGPPEAGIWGIEAYEHMIRYRDSLIANIGYF